MKIAIIGGGNVGRTLGVKLDILSHDVTIVESNLPERIQRLTVSGSVFRVSAISLTVYDFIFITSFFAIYTIS